MPAPVFWFGVLGVYSLASSIAFGMPLYNLLQPEFYRRDAKFFTAYAPLLAAASVGLSWRCLGNMLRVVVILSAIVAAAGAVEYAAALAGSSPRLLVDVGLDGLLYFRGVGTSHNATGGLYAVLAIYAFAQLVTGAWKSWVWWAALAMLVAAVVMTLSRSFVVALALTLALGAVRWGRVRTLLGAWLILGAAVELFGGHAISRFLALRAPEEEANVVGRIEYWRRAIDYALGSPVFGIGFSRFNDGGDDDALEGIRGVLQWKPDVEIRNDDAHAHNSLLMVWAETGLVGVVLWGLVWMSILRVARAYADRLEVPLALRGFGRGVVLATLLILMVSVVDHSLVAPSIVWPAGFFAGGLLGACGRLHRAG